MSESLGSQFAHAMAAKDHDRIRTLLHPELDFQAMTPRRIWDATGPDQVIDAVGVWFGESDEITKLEAVDTDAFSDRERVGYRLRITNPDGEHLVEQQAFLTPKDGKIGWLRIMCSGYRPAD
jgi:hypothetical protein